MNTNILPAKHEPQSMAAYSGLHPTFIYSGYVFVFQTEYATLRRHFGLSVLDIHLYFSDILKTKQLISAN